jgi:hypothetical protein
MRFFKERAADLQVKLHGAVASHPSMTADRLALVMNRFPGSAHIVSAILLPIGLAVFSAAAQDVVTPAPDPVVGAAPAAPAGATETYDEVATQQLMKIVDLSRLIGGGVSQLIAVKPAHMPEKLLESCLRMRLTGSIVGEIRGVEANDLLEAINTGPSRGDPRRLPDARLRPFCAGDALWHETVA